MGEWRQILNHKRSLSFNTIRLSIRGIHNPLYYRMNTRILSVGFQVSSVVVELKSTLMFAIQITIDNYKTNLLWEKIINRCGSQKNS